jgi:acyl-CoA dehydrogenase
LKVLDWAIQMHGGGGVSDDFPLAALWAGARTLRLADGPDEVHREQIGKLELSRYRPKSPDPKTGS